jgi:hypothetical protein
MTIDDRTRVRKSKKSTSNAPHPIAVGETISVFGISRLRGPFTEGRAVISAISGGRNRYQLRFPHEPVLRERIVHREFQEDPRRFLEMLRDLWHSSATEAFDEFFPEKST